jgi:hypothetical protein
MGDSSDAELLQQGLRRLVEVIRASAADGKITLPELSHIFGQIVETASNLAGTLSDRQANFEPLVEALERIYDQHIAPLDIRLVPNCVEKRWVDPWFRKRIRPWVADLYEALGE